MNRQENGNNSQRIEEIKDSEFRSSFNNNNQSESSSVLSAAGIAENEESYQRNKEHQRIFMRYKQSESRFYSVIF